MTGERAIELLSIYYKLAISNEDASDDMNLAESIREDPELAAAFGPSASPGSN